MYENIIVSSIKERNFDKAIYVALEEVKLPICTDDRKFTLCVMLYWMYNKLRYFTSAKLAINMAINILTCNDEQKARLYNEQACLFYEYKVTQCEAYAFISIFNVLDRTKKIKNNDIQETILANLDKIGSFKDITNKLLEIILLSYIDTKIKY